MSFQPFQHLYSHIKKSDPRLYETLDRISSSLHQLDLSITTSSNSGVVTSIYLFATLVANTNIISPVTPSDGVLLVVKLLQDGTGGWVTTWDSNFNSVPNLGSLDPNTYCTITFIGAGAKWWVISLIINQSI